MFTIFLIATIQFSLRNVMKIMNEINEEEDIKLKSFSWNLSESFDTLTLGSGKEPFWVGNLIKPEGNIDIDDLEPIDCDSLDIITKTKLIRLMLQFQNVKFKMQELFKNNIEKLKSKKNSTLEEAQNELNLFWIKSLELKQIFLNEIKILLQKEKKKIDYERIDENIQKKITNYIFSFPFNNLFSHDDIKKISEEYQIEINKIQYLIDSRKKNLELYFNGKRKKPKWVSDNLNLIIIENYIKGLENKLIID